MKAAILACAVVAATCVAVMASAGPDLSRVHVVDRINSLNGGTNYFVRGNQPSAKNSSGEWSIDYDEWMSYIRTRANEYDLNGTTVKPNHPFPANNSRVFIVDVSLEVFFNSGYEAEPEFFKANPDKGRFMNWVLVGAVVWPTSYTPAQQNSMIQDGKVWEVDQLPTRIKTFRDMLRQDPPAGYDTVVYYVHCQAGCDRTGEFVGAYRMTYDFPDVASPAPLIRDIYNENCAECGRCPNYFSSGAQGWYCLTMNLLNRTNPATDCTTAYKCDLFKSCTSTNV